MAPKQDGVVKVAPKQDGVGRDLTDLAMGGAAAMFATLFTNPLEVVKTRLQLQGELSRARAVHYRSVPHGLWVIGRTEGLRALQSGLPAMMGFQFFLNTFRLGVHRICERRGLTTDAQGRTALRGGACAAAGGALGSVAGAPFYLVKTRLQAQAARAIAVGHQHAHAGTFAALREIYAAEGVRGLFRGAVAQVPRGAAGSGAQILSYSLTKDWLRARGVSDPVLVSFLAASVGGVVMTVCLNPFDVVATRLSNQPVSASGRGALYSGAAECLARTVRAEGVRGLYKGLTANGLRLAPHSALLLLAWDLMKAAEARWRGED